MFLNLYKTVDEGVLVAHDQSWTDVRDSYFVSSYFARQEEEDSEGGSIRRRRGYAYAASGVRSSAVMLDTWVDSD
jgi:hypothetical protein